MFPKNLTEEEKLFHAYGHVVRNGEDFLFTEDGLQILQFLKEHPYSSEDVSKALQDMHQRIVGL